VTLSCALIPGAGSAGLTWSEVADELQAVILDAPDEVSERLVEWMTRNPPGILEKMAKICLADSDDAAKVERLVADYEAAGHERHIRQVQAMAAYRPEPLREPPPTVVLWGVHDSPVPLEDHVRLALECRGALVPIADAAHVPFFEQPAAMLEWMRRAALLAESARTRSRR
jgi:pimeloyl-ACP methyl ester carboxylesterase